MSDLFSLFLVYIICEFTNLQAVAFWFSSHILKIYNYQGVANEDYNTVNTPAPNDLQATTPAPIAQNEMGDDDDDEPLNEDDDDDLDDVDQGEELNTQHLVLAQFDKVILLFLQHASLLPITYSVICIYTSFGSLISLLCRQ